MNWATRLPPSHTSKFDVPEMHVALFQPNGDRGGMARVVAFMLPETPWSTVCEGLKLAHDMKARVLFCCDTADQAQRAASIASEALPQHARVSLERAELGAWGFPQ